MRLIRQTCVLGLSAVMVFGQTSSLQIRAVEGDGSTVAAGASSSQPLTVLVTDAGGRPISGAIVMFRLPAYGPTARFSSGMLSESIVTGSDGKASVRGVRWGHEAGSAIVRVSASLNDDRADAELRITVAPGAGASTASDRNAAKSSSRKWLILAGVAGAVAGIALGMGGGSSASPSAPPQQPSQPIVIQPPTISIGKP